VPLYRPYSSHVPDAMDALVEFSESAFAESDPRVYVRDGPWTASESQGSEPQDLCIGWYGFYPGYSYPTRSLSEELGAAEVTSSNELQGMGPSQLERYSVACASIAASGMDATHANFSVIRRAAFSNIATLAGMAADPNVPGPFLNGAALTVTIAADASLHQVAARRGILAIVTFTILAESFSQQL
jgi:hypothetical protein